VGAMEAADVMEDFMTDLLGQKIRYRCLKLVMRLNEDFKKLMSSEIVGTRRK
jgi:hypothetical protein